MLNLMMSEVLNCLGHKKIENDFKVTGFSTDTRTIKKGDIFIALTGKNFDGHDFISVAIKKGASAVICSKKPNLNIMILLVENTLKAYQDLASLYRSKLDIPVIAITGSNGKTTTKNMLATILSSKYKVYYSEKNYNNEIGLPHSIFSIDETHEVALLEMGMNHQGEISTLSKIAKPDIAIITNIGTAHIGFLGSKDNIFKAKLEITDGLKKNGTLIVNSDDEYLSTLTNAIQIGTNNLSEINSQKQPSTFTMDNINFTLPTFGKHNINNAVLAIHCANILGVSLSECSKALKNYVVSPMRTEVAHVKGISIIKDYYNSSPESARVALEVLSNYNSHGKKIAILGQTHELGEFSSHEHKTIAETCKLKNLDKVFFIGKNHQNFKEGFGKSEVFGAEQRTLLTASLFNYVSRLNSGDVILIKGSRAVKMEEFYELLKACINAVLTDIKPLPSSPTKLYVDVNAIKHNHHQIKQAVGTDVEIMPMVKANAYGSGTDIVANIFKDSKFLSVADIKEAALIRRVLPNANILIIYQASKKHIKEIVSQGYICSVSDIDFAVALNNEAKIQNKTAVIHIEIDTGSARLGVKPQSCEDFAKKISTLENIKVDGLFMHYICADSYTDDDLKFTQNQTDIFINSCCVMQNYLKDVKFRHACAGAAIFNENAKHLDMVRPGYMLYGYYPNELLKSKVNLKPSLKFVSEILQISEYEAGTSISYNRRFTTTRKSRIATVAVGYSDGLFRKLFNPNNKTNGCYVINGQKAPIVGSICMDLSMIDITDIVGDIKVGDEVAIFDNINVTIDEMAEICETIGYEIISQIEDKADRIEIFR